MTVQDLEHFDNLPLIEKEFEMLKGQFVLCNYNVMRLIGILEDEWDYYYILHDGRDVYYNTCLYHITPLRDHIYESHYQYMKRDASLNYLDQLPASAETHQQDIEEKILKEGKILFGLHWEIE